MDDDLGLIQFGMIFGSIIILISLITCNIVLWHFRVKNLNKILLKFPKQITTAPKPPMFFKKDVMFLFLDSLIVDLVAIGVAYIVLLAYLLEGERLLVTEMISQIILFGGIFGSLIMNLCIYKKYNKKWTIYSSSKALEQFKSFFDHHCSSAENYSCLVQKEIRDHQATTMDIEQLLIREMNKISHSDKDEEWKLLQLAKLHARHLINFSETDASQCYVRSDDCIKTLTNERLGEIIDNNFFFFWKNLDSF